MLDQRGSIPRNCCNSLVFLASDRNRLNELDQAVRQHRAWRSIENEIESLNLDAFRSNPTKTKREQAEELEMTITFEDKTKQLIPPIHRGRMGIMASGRRRLENNALFRTAADRSPPNSRFQHAAGQSGFRNRSHADKGSGLWLWV